MISGFNVGMIAVIFRATFMGTAGSVRPSAKAIIERIREVKMKSNGLKGLLLLIKCRYVAIMAVADADLKR